MKMWVKEEPLAGPPRCWRPESQASRAPGAEEDETPDMASSRRRESRPVQAQVLTMTFAGGCGWEERRPR